MVESQNEKAIRKEAMTRMFVNHRKLITKHLQPSLTLMADSDAGGSRPENEEVQEKIKTSRNRKIPLVKFILLLAVIIIAVVLLEYFI